MHNPYFYEVENERKRLVLWANLQDASLIIGKSSDPQDCDGGESLMLIVCCLWKWISPFSIYGNTTLVALCFWQLRVMVLLARGKIWLPSVGSAEFIVDQSKNKLINPQGPLEAPFSLLRTNEKSPEKKSWFRPICYSFLVVPIMSFDGYLKSKYRNKHLALWRNPKP
jgi:hypothetical protein